MSVLKNIFKILFVAGVFTIGYTFTVLLELLLIPKYIIKSLTNKDK